MKTFARTSLFTFALLAGFSAIATSGKGNHATPKPEPASAEVKIDNFSFAPQSISVSPGTKVTWKNRDDIPHTVVSTEQVFKSRVLDTEETFSFTFEKPGTYPYFCSVHPKMTGQVVVK
jgi:plastocyanin